MRKKNYKGGKCIKKTVSKAKGVCRVYDDLQLLALDELEVDKTIVEIQCNVVLKGSEWDAYTTDFLCKTVAGDLVVYECCYRKLLLRPRMMELLDGSRNYWLKRGVEWRLLVDANDGSDA